MSDTLSSQRCTRLEDCRIGDWVLGFDVPQWEFDRSAREYQPISSASAWLFRGSFRADAHGTLTRIWLRES